MTDLKTLKSTTMENNSTIELIVSSKKAKAFFPNIVFMLYMTAIAFWFFQVYTTF